MKSKVYKIATYGGKASGKTCILAAMTLARRANPSGFTCTWEPEKPKSSVSGQALPPDDPYLAGWCWIDAQRRRLANSELPEGNKVTDILKYIFSITSPIGGMKSIELIDYSGELIHLSGDKLKEILKKHMRECDGIMILAEVPRKEDDGNSLAFELESLKQAFTSLFAEKNQGAKEEWPIALILNKWDRLAINAPKDAAEAEKGVQAFLSQTPRPPHSQMVDTLANVVPDGFMKSFAVSAFGAHNIGSSGQDVPKLKNGMLESYGLEDPLVWLVERAEIKETRQIADAVIENSNPWHPLQLLMGKSVQEAKDQPGGLVGLSTRKALESCANFLNRIDAKNPNVQVVRAARATLRRNGFIQSVLLAFLVFLSINLFNFCMDCSEARKIEFILTGKNKTVTQDDVQKAENWALSYAHESTVLRLFSQYLALWPSHAGKLVMESHEKRDEAAWTEVINALIEGDKSALSIKYLAYFPAGKHQDEAKGIIEKTKGIADDLNNDAHLTALENKSRQLGLNYEEIDSIEKAANKMPNPDRHTRTENGQVLYEQIKKNLAMRRLEEDDRIRNKKWEEFKSDVAKAVNSNLYNDAAKMLVDKRISKIFPSEDALANLENNVFKVSAERGIQEKVNDAIVRRVWDEARMYANILYDQNVIKLLKLSDAEATSRVEDLVAKVNEAQDNDIYLAIKRKGTESRSDCNKYLNLPFIPKHDKSVREYRDYLDSLENDMPINLSLSKIQIDKEFYNWYGNLNGEIVVSIDGKELIHVQPVYMPRGGELPNLGDGTIKAKFKQGLNLKVEVRIRQGYISNSNSSVIYTDNSSMPVTVEELNKGFELPIKGSRSWTNTACFQITGVPVEPKLP